MIKKTKNFFLFILKKFFFEDVYKGLILKAKILSLKHNKFNKIKDLSDVEFQVFSQWGEDGIIDWLINKFPKIPKKFLEIGTEDYVESNTRYLLINKNWDGYLIEGNKVSVKKIKSQRIYWRHNLKIENKFVNKENINSTIEKLKIPKKIGLLSIDIDGIDYWVLKNITNLIPMIIVCEYNSIFGKNKSITVPYKKNFFRTSEHHSNLFYGASIKAYINLLKKKNYHFLGTNSAGNNAFFIHNDYSNKAKKIIYNNKIFMSKFREGRNKKNKLNYIEKTKALKLLKNKLIFDLNNQKIKKISDINL